MTDKTSKRVAARWRKQPDETGLRRLTQSRRGFDLVRGGEMLAHVRPISSSGWYWYGFGNITANNTIATPDEAKAQVMSMLKEAANG